MKYSSKTVDNVAAHSQVAQIKHRQEPCLDDQEGTQVFSEQYYKQSELINQREMLYMLQAKSSVPH